MRYATNMINRNMLDSINAQNTKLLRLQTQLSTGQKYQTASENPMDYANTLGLDHAKNRISQTQRNIDTLNQRMGFQESVLNTISDNLQRVRELAIQSGNPVLDESSRGAISEELRSRLNEVVDMANTQDANGEFIFAGNTSKTRPFEVSAVGDLDTVRYQGTDHVRELSVSESRTMPLGLVGRDIFFNANADNALRTESSPDNTGSARHVSAFVADADNYVPDRYTVTFTSPTDIDVTDSGGASVGTFTYTPGEPFSVNGVKMSFSGPADAGDTFSVEPSEYQDVFTTINQLRETLNDEAIGSGQLAGVASQSVSNITQALEHIVDQRSQLGSRLNAVESHNETIEELNFQIETRYSRLNDTDFAKTASQLAQQTAILQAAQQTFSRVQNLSLFNYLQ